MARLTHSVLDENSVGSNATSMPSNWVKVSDGIGGVWWSPQSGGGGSVSFGSNATDVSSTSAVGGSSNSAREDHVHRGVRTITANTSNGKFGDYNIQQGTGIAFGVSGQTLTISNIGSGSGGGGGGGSSTIQYPALKPGSPTDDFAAATLAGGWSAQSHGGSFVTGNCITQAVDGSHLSMDFSAQEGYLYQSASNVDQEWIVGGMIAHGYDFTIGTMMWGIALLDSSENGEGIVVYNDGSAYLATIAGGNYTGFDGSFVNLGHNNLKSDHYWLRLTRVGNVWDGYISFSGRAWDVHASATGTHTITVARKCIGIFYQTGSTYSGRLECDWVNTV
jgi:hypothetical protein